MPSAPSVELEPCPPHRVLLAEDDAATRALQACRLRRACAIGDEPFDLDNPTTLVRAAARGLTRQSARALSARGE